MEGKKPFISPVRKVILTFIVVFSLLIRIPYLLVYYSVRSLRPHPRWSLQQCLINDLLRIWSRYMSATHFQPPQSLEPDNEKERWTLISPAASHFYRDPLLDAEIKPGTTGGTWYPRPYDKKDKDSNVILHIHGGAFVGGDSRHQICGFAAASMTEAFSCLMFVVEYRLASHPGGRFPAALQDIVSSYQYLLELGIPPSSIIISGDSAGGNLALVLLRYLYDNSNLFEEKPSAALLWSPWLDLTMPPADFETHRNSKTDYLVADWLDYGLRMYAPPHLPLSHPYLSPGKNPFTATQTSIWVQFGNLEILADQAKTFVENMEALKGNRVSVCEVEVQHDILLVGHILGRKDKMREAISSAAEFLKKHK